MGALVAMAAALAWPDKVRGLVLCAAAPRMPVSDDFLRVAREEPARLPEWLAEHGLSPRARPAVRRSFVAAGIVAPPRTTVGDLEALRAADLGPRVKDLACPVVWLDGADDRIVGAPGPRPGVARALPDVGHLVPIEAPAAVVEAAAELARR
jgi:pimeloyl-ACP methyl ester carboxylesterase